MSKRLKAKTKINTQVDFTNITWNDTDFAITTKPITFVIGYPANDKIVPSSSTKKCSFMCSLLKKVSSFLTRRNNAIK